MALKATLKLDGKSYDVKDLEYEISKPCNNNYKPSASPRGGIISFTILSPMDKNLVFHEWLLSISDVKKGEFRLPLTNGIKHVVKTLSFDRAHCVNLRETYSCVNSLQMYMRITISATIISFGPGVEFRNKEFPL